MERRIEYWDDYRCWLMNICGLFDTTYDDLCRILHSIDAFGRDYDTNRFEDGLNQRTFYIEKLNWDEQYKAEEELKQHKCSFFEMIVALAVRIDDEYLGDPKQPNAGKWLDEMLRGLDILKYGWNVSQNQERIVRKRVDFMLNREYDDRGNCNIFQLRRPYAGFRDLPIWQQMQIWMSERYGG